MYLHSSRRWPDLFLVTRIAFILASFIISQPLFIVGHQLLSRITEDYNKINGIIVVGRAREFARKTWWFVSLQTDWCVSVFLVRFVIDFASY